MICPGRGSVHRDRVSHGVRPSTRRRSRGTGNEIPENNAHLSALRDRAGAPWGRWPDPSPGGQGGLSDAEKPLRSEPSWPLRGLRTCRKAGSIGQRVVRHSSIVTAAAWGSPPSRWPINPQHISGFCTHGPSALGQSRPIDTGSAAKPISHIYKVAIRDEPTGQGSRRSCAPKLQRRCPRRRSVENGWYRAACRSPEVAARQSP